MDRKEPLGPPELPKKFEVVEPVASQSLPQEESVDDEPDVLNQHVETPGDPDGLIAAEEQRKWRAGQPILPVSPASATAPKRRWPIVLLFIVLLAAAAAGAYWLGGKKADPPASKTSQTSQAKSQQPAVKTVNVPAKHYDSTTYTLGIDYPGDWVVSDTAAKLTVTSPAMKMTNLDGAVTGHVIVTIQNQQTTIPGYPASGAMANLASDKLTYKQPSSVQRAQTYLSYVGYKSPNGVDALFLTGDNGYQLGQQVPMSDVVKGNPLVSVTFAKCADSNCVNGTPTPITLLAASWKNAAFKPQIVDLLQSLTLD